MSASSIETARLERKLAALAGQARFAAALALTQLAKDGQAAARHRIEEAFDRPTPFTRNAVAITPARKSALVSQVFVKDIQASYLAIQETGGERRPQPGAPIIVPVEISTNVYGNIARGRVKREVAKPTTFVSREDTPRTRHLPPGIYQRYKHTKRGRARPPKLLVALEKVAHYQPRFRFRETVEKTVIESVQRRWREAVVRALETARR